MGRGLKVCKNCIHFYERMWARECRRYPPSVANGSWYFTEIQETDWCGEFEPNEEIKYRLTNRYNDGMQ